MSDNCFTGVNIPNQTTEPCGGIYTSTECIIQESAIPYLNLPTNSSVKNIISNLVLALLYKDEQIANQTTIIESLQEQVIPKYKVYTALLTQSGTNAPIANILENTIGNIVWTYEGNGVTLIGDYKGTLNGAFLEGKTSVSLTTYADDVSSSYTSTVINFTSEDFIRYNTMGSHLNVGDNSQDNINVLIEIRVYN